MPSAKFPGYSIYCPWYDFQNRHQMPFQIVPNWRRCQYVKYGVSPDAIMQTEVRRLKLEELNLMRILEEYGVPPNPLAT
jgi:hypothetical protein